MKSLRWIVGGVVAGAIGAAVWAAIAYFANAEVGFVAWGIGFAVGFGVRLTASKETKAGLGFGAASIALVAILLGKYLAVTVAVSGLNLSEQLKVTPETMVMAGAYEIAKEWSAQGKRLLWPRGKTMDNAKNISDFPSDVTKASREWWASLDKAEQDRLMAEQQKMFDQIATSLSKNIRGEGFKASFSPYDIIWFILAVVSAYKIGSRTPDGA